MEEIRQLLDAARRRLVQTRFLRGLHYGLVGGALLVLLVVLLAKTSPAIAEKLPLLWIAGGAALVAVLTGVLFARALRLTPMTMAVLVDERLGLKERLSTAMAVRDRADGFARAAVADAVTAAKDPRHREALRRHFAVRAPDSSWIGPVIAAAAIGAWFLPQGDFFKPTEQAEEIARAKNDIAAAKTEVQRILEKNDRLKELGKKLGDVTGEATPPDELPETPEEARQEAIKRLTEAQNKLNDVLKSEDAQKLDMVKDKLAQLDADQGSETADLTKALKEGDFKKAQEALEALKAKAENDPAKKAEIEKQLEGLGKQIEKLAENKAGLEKALQKANLDPKLAGNKEALERALENAKGLTEQQKQDIRKAAEAQQRAQEKMQEMSKACNGACDKPGGQKSGGNQGQSKSGEQGEKGGQKSGDGKDGEKQQGGKGESGQQKQGQPGDSQQAGTGSMSEMLSDLEALDQMLKDAEAAMSECDKQAQGLGQAMCNMPGQCEGNQPGNQAGNNIGNRRGGHGRANGGNAGVQKSPTATKIQKEKVELTAGDIISRQAVEGQSERGESSVPLNEVINEIARSMEQGVVEEEVPQHLREIHKVYFGDLKNKIDAARGPAPAAPAGGDAAKPAAGEKPAAAPAK